MDNIGKPYCQVLITDSAIKLAERINEARDEGYDLQSTFVVPYEHTTNYNTTQALYEYTAFMILITDYLGVKDIIEAIYEACGEIQKDIRQS